jgi:hypothetical protein
MFERKVDVGFLVADLDYLGTVDLVCSAKEDGALEHTAHLKVSDVVNNLNCW